MDGTILALGSVNADFEVRVERPLGETDTEVAHDLRRLGGGKAANVALLARHLGHAAWLLGRVGDDDLAEQALAPLHAAGVDLTGVAHAQGCSTGLAMIFVPPSGKKRIVVTQNANDGWGDAEIAAACWRIAAAPKDSVLVADCEVPAAVVKRAAAVARERGLRVVLDPTFPERVDVELLGGVDAITPNAAEARRLPGVGSGAGRRAEDIARILAAQGPRTVCIKLEDGGCVVCNADGLHRFAAAEVEVVDSTGAGDAFTAAFAVGWLEGQPDDFAARLAVAASTTAVRGYGAQPSYPERPAVERMLRRQSERPRA